MTITASILFCVVAAFCFVSAVRMCRPCQSRGISPELAGSSACLYLLVALSFLGLAAISYFYEDSDPRVLSSILFGLSILSVTIPAVAGRMLYLLRRPVRAGMTVDLSTECGLSPVYACSVRLLEARVSALERLSEQHLAVIEDKSWCESGRRVPASLRTNLNETSLAIPTR